MVALNSRNDCETATVKYQTEDGTATVGSDYTSTSGTLTFGPGETAKTVSVPVLDDSTDDGQETFTLKLSDASGATIADETATGTILDEALRTTEPQVQPRPVVSIAAATNAVTEGTAAAFVLTLDESPSDPLTISVGVTEDGSALSGTPPTSVTFVGGGTSATLSVPTVADSVVEAASTVTAAIAAGTGYTVGSAASAAVTVLDDDTATFTVSASPQAIAEGRPPR